MTYIFKGGLNSMVVQSFLPEARHKLTTLDPSLDPRCYIGEVVSCSPRRYDYSKNELEVFIGNSFFGIIPLSELSIYDLKDINRKTLFPFLKEQCLITAKIIGYSSDTNLFTLSRKSNMKDALSYFSALEGCEETIFARKTGSSGAGVFVDIGAGIYGLIPFHEISSSYINVKNCFKDLDYIPVHILYQNLPGKFIVSYKSTVSYQDFKVGDIVSGRVAAMVKDSSGIFIELNSNQSGILNADFGLQIAHCNNADENWFIIFNESNNFPPCAIKENETYLFSIKALKDDPSHFKLALL